MDLKKRLARLDRSTRKPGAAGAAPAVDAERHAATMASLGLERIDTRAGEIWRRDHAAVPVVFPDEPADLRGVFTRCTDRDPPDRGDFLFLDTETTGLAGGTGSLAFLVGTGWWEKEGFVVRQHFLPGPGRESPLLADLAGLAERFTHVVTFNGNGFDLPLLRTRALLSRQPDPCGGLESWDLLPAARRLWGRRLPDCRQQTVEEDLRGRQRGAGDIDGARIPQVYFDFLREGVSGELENVLTHNRRDMVGMAEILAAVASRALMLPDPRSAAASRLPWADAWACGRVCELRGERECAAGWITLAWRRRLADDVPTPFHADAVRLLKRTRDWSLVEEILHDGLAVHGDVAWLHREAAILYEHRLDRPEEALRHARAIDEPNRLARLERKLGAGGIRAASGVARAGSGD